MCVCAPVSPSEHRREDSDERGVSHRLFPGSQTAGPRWETGETGFIGGWVGGCLHVAIVALNGSRGEKAGLLTRALWHLHYLLFCSASDGGLFLRAFREPNTFLIVGHQQMRQSSAGGIQKRCSVPHLTVENVPESRTLVRGNVGDRRKEPAVENRPETEHQSS